VASAPLIGPSVSAVSAQRQPIPPATVGSSRIVATVIRNPIA
jgi:hypothetical protein